MPFFSLQTQDELNFSITLIAQKSVKFDFL
nr:MAG TPA: hypothetical protein [Caudoviricetes sp.]